ncbi:MAG: FAD-binding oxidoreductase [Pseudomonadota bacterium]
MSSDRDYIPGFKSEPYWWDGAPLSSETEDELPGKCDVLIIGAGYTGLHAAIQAVAAGLDTIVIDAENLGFGCSTRNGGQISTCIKPTYPELKNKYGEKLALAIKREGEASLKFVSTFVNTNKIDCDFSDAGRFHGAHSARQYEQLARNCEVAEPEFSSGAYMVPKSQQHDQLKTEAYFGGIVFPRYATIDPAKYHAGLLKIARAQGAQTVGFCRATNIDRNPDGFTISTSKGKINANKIVVATNGYTTGLTPHIQRRLIPIGSYIIATEEIPEALMSELFPTDRAITDTRKTVYYYRPSPDRRRILFGGRVSLSEVDPLKSGPILLRDLKALFPELSDFRISHTWGGVVAFTFDTLMHTGNDDGIYYAGGYCGSGVGMASYLGMKIGKQVADKADGETPFDELRFPTIPFYHGRPWFLAPSILYYRLRDRIGI